METPVAGGDSSLFAVHSWVCTVCESQHNFYSILWFMQNSLIFVPYLPPPHIYPISVHFSLSTLLLPQHYEWFSNRKFQDAKGKVVLQSVGSWVKGVGGMLLGHFNLKERGKILISERMKVEKWLFSLKFSYPLVLLSRLVFIIFPLQHTIKNTFCIRVKFALSLAQTHTPEIKFKKYHMPCTII